MKQKVTIFQYGSQLDPTHPTHYSPNDWMEISISGSSPSERSCSMEAPKASNSSASDASNGGFAFDSSMGDDHSITAFVPPEALDLFLYICTQFEHLMATTEKTLPSQWSLPEFSLAVIGEKAVEDRPHLIDVFSDLSQHGSQSWYWEEAVKLLTRITSSANF